MDRRTKKRIAGLRTKLDTLAKKLAGAKAQADDPGEVGRVEAQIQQARDEITRLKSQ